MHTQGKASMVGGIVELHEDGDLLKPVYATEWNGTLRVGMKRICDFLSFTTEHPGFNVPGDEQAANAERVAALWNAADGLDLEDAVRAMASHQMLLEALMDMVSDHECLSEATLAFARRAIAAARGE